MNCVTKDNTLTYLVNNNYINSLRAITGNDVDKFNIINKKLTEHGIIKYGLMPAPGELLFNVDPEKHIRRDANSKAYSLDVSYDLLYRAVPNELLFNALQDCVNSYEEKNERALGLTDISEETEDESKIKLVFSSAYGDNGYNLDIIKDNTKVGTVNYELDNGIATVGAIAINEGYKRQGLATDAYITLGDSLADQDIALRSGELNSLSKGLWNKLVDQGKAQMIDKNVYEYIPTNTDKIPDNIFNKDLAKKIQTKLEKLYPEIKLNITNNPIWEQGDNIFNQEEYNNQINYRIKAVDLLLTSKADQVFLKGFKNKWTLDQMLSELQIPKNQKELIESVVKTMPYRKDLPFNAQIATVIAATYSYTIETNLSSIIEETPFKIINKNISTEESKDLIKKVQNNNLYISDKEKIKNLGLYDVYIASNTKIINFLKNLEKENIILITKDNIKELEKKQSLYESYIKTLKIELDEIKYNVQKASLKNIPGNYKKESELYSSSSIMPFSLKEILNNKNELDLENELDFYKDIYYKIKYTLSGYIEYGPTMTQHIADYKKLLPTYLNLLKDLETQLKNINNTLIIPRNIIDPIKNPTQHHSNLTVPGGTNYTENAIRTVGIINFKSADGGYHDNEFNQSRGDMAGWFRSDDKTISTESKEDYNKRIDETIKTLGEQKVPAFVIDKFLTEENEKFIIIDNTKTRRILELQSFFQKVRDKKDLTAIENIQELPSKFETLDDTLTIITTKENNKWYEKVIEYKDSEYEQTVVSKKEITSKKAFNNYYNIIKEEGINKSTKNSKNQFLQLLNKDSYWVTFFIKSIIQDSAKKGYEKVLFPSGDTASKVEGHTTLEGFKKEKEDRIKSIEAENEKLNIEIKEKGIINSELERQILSDNNYEIERYKQELERVEKEGFGTLRPIYNFYENTVANILKKQGYTPEVITDEYGNTWYTVNINQARELQNILLQKNEANKIIGQANIKAVSVLVDAINQKQDTLPHEYAHHYIAWYRNTPIVQEAIKKWGSEEALVQAIGEQVVAQKGEAYEWWKKFIKWILNNFDSLSKLDKDKLSKILTDAFLTRENLKVNLDSQQTIQEEPMFLKLDAESSQKARANEVAEILADRLSKNLKTSYQIITETEAKQILKNRVISYNGEPAFFFGGIVYFVGDNFNLETALHEFGHPLIGAIRVENVKLFNNLFTQVKSTTEGQAIIKKVKRLYPELTTGSPLFMEEVIVHALQQTAYDKITNTPQSEGFVSFIKNLLYSIKQIFRSFFSNTQNISKINESTTLGELADMMVSKDFEYQSDLVTDEDIAMFSRYTNARVKILTKNVSENAMQSAINNFYASTSSMLNSAKKFSKKSNLYPMLQKTLFIEGTNELLPAIKKSLTPYQSIVDTGKASKDEIIEEVIESELRRIKDMTNKSINFVSSLEITNNIIKNIYKDLLDIQKDKNFGERSTLSVLGIYRTNLSNYIEFIDDTVELFKEDFNLDSSNALSNLLSEMNTNAKSAITLLQKIYKDSSVDFYRTYTAYMQEFLDDKLKKDLGNALKNKLTAEELEDFYDKVVSGNIADEDMAKIIAKGVEKKYINDFISEYNYLKIDELKLRDILSGNAKDVSWFNRFLESYTSSNDPIVGGLAMYIQNIKTDAQLKTLNETEVFRGKLEPILKANNINYNNTAQVADLISSRDEVLGYDEKGEVVKKEIFTLKNEWKGYRYEQSKLQNDYSKALETKDKEAIATAAAALKQFKKDYMYDKYTKIVLDADDIFNESPVHRLAWLTRKQALEDFNSELSIFSTELERFEKYSSAQALWRKYQQLYELNYIDGSPKVDDPENNIYDLSIALILREHKEKTSDFYESVAKEGSLQTSYNEFINSIIAEGVSKEVFNEMNAKWIRQNTRVAYSETYYTRKKELITRLKELQDKKTDKSEFNTGEAFSEIYDLLFSFRDSQGQPIPSELKAERIQKIKELQQKINDSKFAEQKTSKLTKAQASELNEFINIIKSKTETLSDEQKLRYLKLIKENTPDGLTALESAEIQGIYSELAEISSKIPTEYYMETMNYYLTQILGKGETSETTVDDLINSESFKDLLSDDTKFRNWFFNNHVTKKRYSRTGDIDIYFERLACYSVSVPNNEEDYIKTKLINPQTGAEFTINGLPNSRHTEFRIKNDPKYRTIPIGEDWKNYIGTIKDNGGNYLPRPYKKGEANSAKDDRFVDYDYLKLKAANNDQYKLIETIKEYYIKFQNDAALGSRLWYDLPRYGKKGMLENLQAGALSDKAKALKGSWDYYWQKMIGKSNDDYELGLNYDAKKNLVTTDMQGNEISYVPVTGTYNLDIEKTSKDFLPGIFQYIQSINMQAKLIESAPLLNSILSVLEDPKNGLKNINKQSRTINKITGKLVNVNKNKGDTYNRLEQVRSLVERELYGRKIVGIEESNPWLHKMSNFMLSAAGRATLAINVPSDLKNRYGQIVQNLIEASGGKYVSLKSMALARPWAAKTMLEWSAVGIYARGSQSLNSQIIQSFDAFFKTEKQFGENLSRTRVKDTLDGSWMYSFRKFGEMEAAMQLFGGFMHHQYVDQITSTGKAVPIRYIDAWELDKDGVLSLKKGINPEWGNKTIYHTVEATDTLESISEKYSIPVDELKAKNRISKNENLIEGSELVIAQSVKFKQFKNKFQTISRRLYGVYDDFGQAEGNKYFIHRMFYFMRKWTTSLFTNRFGADLSKENRWGRRYDWGLGETSRGYYISGIASLYKLIKSAGKYYPYMSPEDKIDTKKMISEGVSVFLFSVLGGLLFAYDPDDDERWEKIKNRSDAFGTEGFKMNGFITNHMLNLLLQVGAETSAFVPLPGLGLDDYNNFISVTSTSFGSTLTLYAKIIEDIFNMVVGKDSAYYKIESGPYSWQKEGQAKIKSHILKTIGITGRTGDVETLIKNYERYSSKIN